MRNFASHVFAASLTCLVFAGGVVIGHAEKFPSPTL
jgi:hypothetical protein